MNNKDKLYALAKSLNLKIPTNADVATSKKIIVEALVAGDVIVSVKDKLTAPPKGVTELPITPADVPEVIDSASLIPSITPELLNELNQSAQAVTLIKAAQNGIPFCKECTKAEMQKDEAKSPAKTENKNINSDSNTDTVAVNNSSPATEKTPVSTESIDATAPTDATKTPASTETVDTPVTADPASITDVGTPPQNTPLVGAAENITTNTAATGSNNADIGENIATIASIATATSAAAVLTGNSTAAVAPITATPTKSPVSSANTEYPETNDSATTTSNSLGTSEQGINNNPASLDSSQVDNSITGISTPEITLTTSGVETSNSANITTNPALSTDELIADKATIDNNIDAKAIATGATAAAAAASSLISNGSGKITGLLKGETGNVDQTSDKVASKKQQQTSASKKVQPIANSDEDLIDIPISLNYNDPDKTPAIKVSYKMTFNDGQIREGVLDENGEALEKAAPSCGATLEFAYENTLEEIDAELKQHYAQLEKDVMDMAEQICQGYIAQIEKGAEEESTLDPETLKIREDLRSVIQQQIEELKAQSAEYEAQDWFSRRWEDTKSAGMGAVQGVTEYIPDLGEFGDLMDTIDIDMLEMTDIIFNGNIDALQEIEAKLKNCDRCAAGFEEAKESMETLILLLSDEETRKILIQLPQKFLEVTPTDKLVEIGASQAAQAGLDATAIAGTTFVAGVITAGPGSVAGAAISITATTARKGGKILEATLSTLTNLSKSLKRKRNKGSNSKISTNAQGNKSQLPDNSGNNSTSKKNEKVTVKIKENDLNFKISNTKKNELEALIVHAEGKPAGGTYTWEINNDYVSKKTSLNKIELYSKKPGKTKLKVIYSHANGNASDSTNITAPVTYRNIYLHVFSGIGRSAIRLLNNKFKQEESGVKIEYTDFDFLSVTGHVGFSFETKNNIFGFGPDISQYYGKESGRKIFERIRKRETFQGKITNDTNVFKEAKLKAIEVIVVEYHVKSDLFDKMLSEFNDKRHKPGLYRFPGGGNKTSGENCATWPRKFGLPLPEKTGELTSYTPKAKALMKKPQEIN
ncbi:hypothetical protein MNBD_GAMMA07-793 [hydrothermal vent metagenome]|uniref:Uncharacterized protein n=1 Tax=hydrothermal vent metagenome TaxID=652676 RepID=A0A3B0XMJ7_9ZZZZ